MLEEWFLSLPAIIDRKSEQKSGNNFFFKRYHRVEMQITKIKKRLNRLKSGQEMRENNKWT